MRPPEPRGLRNHSFTKISHPEEALNLCTAKEFHTQPISIQHWQLRDLIHCPDTSDEVFISQNTKILKLNLRSLRCETISELSFQPTCITAKHGLVAAGGQSAQLDLRRISTDCNQQIFKGLAGSSVNNSVRLAKDASHTLRLFVCNNDDSIKLFNVAVGALISTIRCPIAINHCAVSPDGRDIVAVGDDRHVYVHHATPTGYRPFQAYKYAIDAGMSCDYSPSGSMFAVASQDGLVTVWDTRSTSRVARFQTMLACRNVRFAPDPLDMLAFTEHRGRAHVADTRMFSKFQTLHVAGMPTIEPDISGLAFSPKGEKLFVGLEDGIVEYSVDSCGRRSFCLAELA